MLKFGRVLTWRWLMLVGVVDVGVDIDGDVMVLERDVFIMLGVVALL